MRRTVCILLIVGFCFVLPSFAHHVRVGASKLMPVTTSSAKARNLYERAMQDYENLYLERCNTGWRAAVAADPNFALAYAWIALNSRNPVEASAARKKAKALAVRVTPGELLMIQWITNVQEGNMILGIAAMNDMLEMYPRDKRLFYLAANWLMGAQNHEQAVVGLQSAAGFLRGLVAERLATKATPELKFFVDDQFEQGEKIERLLHEIDSERNK